MLNYQNYSVYSNEVFIKNTGGAQSIAGHQGVIGHIADEAPAHFFIQVTGLTARNRIQHQ